jgi:hypothetical protein
MVLTDAARGNMILMEKSKSRHGSYEKCEVETVLWLDLMRWSAFFPHGDVQPDFSPLSYCPDQETKISATNSL